MRLASAAVVSRAIARDRCSCCDSLGLDRSFRVKRTWPNPILSRRRGLVGNTPKCHLMASPRMLLFLRQRAGDHSVRCSGIGRFMAAAIFWNLCSLCLGLGAFSARATLALHVLLSFMADRVSFSSLLFFVDCSESVRAKRFILSRNCSASHSFLLSRSSIRNSSLSASHWFGLIRMPNAIEKNLV